MCSKDLISPQVNVKVLDKKENHLFDIKNQFQAKLLPKNLPKYLKGLDHETSYEYPDVLTSHLKTKKEEALWKYRLEVLDVTFENLAVKKAICNSNTVTIMETVRKEKGEWFSARFKKTCIKKLSFGVTFLVKLAHKFPGYFSLICSFFDEVIFG